MIKSIRKDRDIDIDELVELLKNIMGQIPQKGETY
jgi:hypothetical protein